MVHSHQVEETRHRREMGMLRGHDTMTKVLLRLSLKSKITQDLRRGFPTKILPMLQGTKTIVYLTQRRKEEQIMVIKVINQIVSSVATGM